MPNEPLLAPNAPVQEGEFDGLMPSPALEMLTGSEKATPGEEEQLKKVVAGATDFIFSEDMAAVIRASDTQGQLFEGVSEVAFQILAREKQKLEESGEKPEPAVFFSETGAVPIVIDALWGVARQAGLPGAEDQDQYAGAVINLFRKMGEHIIEEGDEDAIAHAEELAVEMAMREEGPQPKHKPVSRGVREALKEPLWVGNTPDGTDLFALPGNKVVEGFEEAGFFDTGTNAAGERISRRVFRRKQ